MKNNKQSFLFLIVILITPIIVTASSFKELCENAMSHFYQQNFDEALSCYQEALEINPKNAFVLFNLGYIFFLQNNTDSAINYLSQAVFQNPFYAKAHLFLARALKKNNQIEKAIIHYQEATTIDFTYADAYLDLGYLFLEQEQYQKALEPFEQFHNLYPNNTMVNQTVAYLLTKLHQFERAIELYKSILIADPTNPTALYNLAFSLHRSGNMHEAIRYYEQILVLKPDHEMAHFGLAKSLLAIGDFERGWQEFEWRMSDQQQYRKNFRFHGITPDEFQNKTVVIRSEWGMGDTIHFIRYAQLLKKHGPKKIIVQTFSPLIKLFSLCDYIDQVISMDDPIPASDIEIPLLSMPLIFGTKQKNIPTNIPYLKAKSDLVQQWKEYLFTTGGKTLKVGLCWQAGIYTFLEDNPLTKRSVPLTIFAALAQLPGITFYSLQREFGTSQLSNVPQKFDVHDFGPNFDTDHGRFMDTAAVIQNLDLVITVDTSIAHLTGALGTPVWIILPSVAEWRWMTEGKEALWYPNAQLFRQPTYGDWESVIQEIKDALKLIINL